MSHISLRCREERGGGYRRERLFKEEEGVGWLKEKVKGYIKVSP